ncbi:dihydroneopterin aldolase [Terrarubrum flagellatum]|uniref:dihydroneopterin aldolase n=1 Tax=Terrirubrum flagellatum TaxID=2895980 RepID=UPI003145464E
MSDKIILSRLAVFAHHGVFEEEARLGQRFFISLTAELDLSEAGAKDEYRLSVDYGKLAQHAHEVATKNRFHTLEGLAEAIATDILAAFPRIQSLSVRIEKPAAPIPLVIDTVAVEIERRRATT